MLQGLNSVFFNLTGNILLFAKSGILETFLMKFVHDLFSFFKNI